MKKFALRVTEISKAELIHRGIAYGPCVRDVDLLRAGSAGIAKSLQQIGSQSLKSGKGLGLPAIEEIIVDGKVLVGAEVVIQSYRKLVVQLAAIRDSLVNVRNGVEYVVGVIGSRHKLLDQVRGHGIETCGWNLAVRTKKRGIRIASGCAQAAASIQDVRQSLVADGTGDAGRREVSSQFGRGRNHYRI